MSSFYGNSSIVGGSGGTPGTGIKDISFDANRNLIIALSDGSSRNLGQIDGTVFTPHLEGSILTWTNDKGLVNPPPFDLRDGSGELWYPVNSSDGGGGDEPVPQPDNTWEPIR